MIELIETEMDVVQEYLSECDVAPIIEKCYHRFKKWHQEDKKDGGGRIFCLDGVQWVAITSEKYFDDAQPYQVTDYATCIEKLEEMTADQPSDDNSTNWKPLLFIIKETGSLGITVGHHPKYEEIHITEIIPSSTAYKLGLKVGDILCKLGSKGTRFVKKENETTVQNLTTPDNRPFILEVLSELSDVDIQNNVVAIEQNVKNILKKATDTREVVGSIVDKMCPTDIYLLSFTYNLLATIKNGEYIPKVVLELLNPVCYSKVNDGPGTCATFIEDQIQWKPKCSKCGKVITAQRKLVGSLAKIRHDQYMTKISISVCSIIGDQYTTNLASSR